MPSKKSKDGAKVLKLPGCVFREWQSIAKDTPESLQQAPGISILLRLADSSGERWEQQVTYIKNATKAISQIKTCSENDLEAIRLIAEPIAAVGYLTAVENHLRKFFIPLVEAIAKHTECTRLKELYKAYISIDPQQHALFGDLTVTQKALAIQATLEFATGKKIVYEQYAETLRYLVAWLDKSRQGLIDGHGNGKATIGELTSDAQHATKTVLALFTRHGAAGYREMFSKTLSAGNEHIQLYAKLMEVLLDMCYDTTIWVKDCCQVAGMTMAAMLNLLDDTEAARDIILGWFFVEDDSSLDAATKASVALGVSPKSVLVKDRGWTGRDIPTLSIVRGLVSCVRKEILLEEIPKDITLVKPLARFARPCNVNEILFYSIQYICSLSDLDAPSKIISFESMAMWLTECKVTMRNKDIVGYVTAVLNQENTECLVRYVWDHWDDPIEAVQQKVKNIFENLLDVLQLRADCLNEQKSYSDFLSRLLKDLITMDWHRKVKYALLNCLVPKVGTEAFLAVEPAFIWKCMRSTNSLVLSPQITALLLAFLQKRVEETIPGFKSFKGQNAKITGNDTNKVYIEDWIKLWAMPALRSLTADSDLLRRNVSTFILQPLLHMCPQAFWHLLTLLQSKKSELNEKYHLHAFIALLKVARSQDIVDSSAYTEEEDPQDPCKVSISTLKLAVHHIDPQVRLDVLGLLCESRKAMSKVTSVELNLLRLFLPLNMNCASPDFRQKLCTHISRVLIRIRGNLHAQWRTHKSCCDFINKNTGTRSESAIQKARMDSRAALDHILYMKDFLYWLQDCIITALYPGSSFQRVSTALRLLNILVKTFGITESPMPEGFTTSPEVPFQLHIATPRTTKVLVDTLTNPFDFNRLLALEILDQFPDPLPGIDCQQDVQDLLWWGLDNVKSARAGESDSGAMIFRLIFNKYVTKLGFDLHPARHNNSKDTRTVPSVELAPVVFTERLMDLLENQIAAAKENLLNAAQHHPMHGTLLALQYVFQELDYSSTSVKNKTAHWKATHARALRLVRAACDAVMDVLSNPSPEGNVPASFREMEEAIDNIVGDAENFDEDETVGPKHQIILSCCWRAVKEASSLLNTIVARTPSAADDSAILRNIDLIESGLLLRSLLTTIRHRGAFSAVYPAYVSLNARLLDSTEAELNKLPARWLEDNLDSITSSNISITRRSAGLPLCILAIVSSDRSARKHMLDTTMKRLLKIAMTEPSANADETIDLPQVHAYNIMRTIFMDAKLGKDVLEYASDGYSLAINGFSSRSWAIRNCSVMLFSTLLQRTFGTKKTKDEHSNVNKLTGREFFTRYPQLHPYLLQELSAAVDQLLASDASGAGIHPGLYPILTLLSRLHPSVMDGSDTVTPMASFVPLVRSCAVSSIYKTREMAARALVPLISSAQIVNEVLSLLDISQGVTQNQMHGRLFQVQFLLRGHLYNLNMRDVLLHFLQAVPDALLRLLDLAFANKLSQITVALLLDIIDEFFIDGSWIKHDRDQSMVADLEAAAAENLREFREKLVDQCIAAMSDCTSKTANIGRSLARRSMAKIIVLCVLRFYTTKKSISDLYYLLDYNDYEVRAVAMEQLNTFIGRHGCQAVLGDAVSELTRRLIQKTFDGETNLECFVQAVKLLQTVLDTDFWKSSPPVTPDAYWKRLVHHLTHKHSQSVTECITPLLGTLLAQFYDLNDTGLIEDCTQTWGSYVVKYSNKYASLPLREATVESMRCMTRHLLTRSNSSVSTMPMRIAITRLLQDDDVDIREAMATSVSEALNLPAFVQPERATELVYMRLLELVSGSSEAKELLEELQSLLIGDANLKTTCIEEINATKLLFAKENPNIYKEDIIDAQWAFILSQQLLQSYRQNLLFCNNLVDIANDLIYFIRLIREKSLHLMLSGPSGFSSMPTIFLAAYKTILAAQLSYDAAAETEASSGQVTVTKELRDCLSTVRQEDLHLLLWQQLQSSNGLSSKIASYLGRHGEFQRAGLFIIS